MKPGITTIAKAPGSCTPEEIASFISLAIAGGEIDSEGLVQRLRRAKVLVFARERASLIGVAGLKNPDEHYRDYVARSSGSAIPRTEFHYELGWVVVAPDARSQGLSYRLSAAALEHSDGAGVFATSHSDRMQNTLSKLGFVAAGKAYPSRLGGQLLQLFVRKPSER